MKVREIGLDLLDNIYKNKSFSNIELNKTLRETDLSNLDKAFLTRLVYGTLKDSIMLDYEIKKATEGKDIKPKIRTLLKMSLYQLRKMEKVPDYAVINEAVDIAKNRFGLMSSKFVNAVLRRLTRETFVPDIKDYKDEIEYYSLINGFPYWIGNMVSKQYDKKIALDYMEAYKEESPIAVRVNKLKSSKQELLDLGYYEESKLSSDGLIYKGDKSINELEEFLNGKIAIQGESSQLIGQLVDPKDNETILDMCAAPGGKTYHIASLMNNTGKVYAIDLYEHRIELLVKNLPRLGIKNVEAFHYDSTKLSNRFKKEYFDRILLDAPCSGLGVVRRKPDILLNIKQNNLDEIIDIQEKLLEQAYILLNKNGTLVYSTCTINKKENELQIEKFLSKHSDMVLVSKETILPSKDIIDGFFMAKLERR